MQLCAVALCRIPPNSLTRSASTLPTRFLNYTARGTPAMRFTASMVSAPNFDCTECDMKRHFVLSFYVEDNTLAISEPPNKETLTGTFSHCSYFFCCWSNHLWLLSCISQQHLSWFWSNSRVEAHYHRRGWKDWMAFCLVVKQVPCCAGGECFFPRQHATKPCLQSPYKTDGAYKHRDLYLGALVPVLLTARRGFEAEGPKMLQLLTADDWTLVCLCASNFCLP